MKRIFLILLSALLLAGCAGGAADVGDETTALTTAAETERTFPEADYCGADFTIITNNRDGNEWGNELYTESIIGEVINDAVFQRNLNMSEKYNTVIRYVGSDNLANDVTKEISAATDAYDAVLGDLFVMSDLAGAGNFIDLNTAANLDLTNPWWDQNSVRDLSIGGKQFFVTGDISFFSNVASWIYLFNKDIVTDYNIENLYDLVNGGTWVVDKFTELLKGISGDVNGDGIMDEQDRYGLITESSNTLGMFFGAGNTVISKDANDYPIISINTERGADAVTTVLEIMNDTNTTTNIEQPFYSWDWKKLDAVFGDDRGLFYSIVLSTVMRIRESDTNFGILPMPKYDEAQTDYYTWVSPYISRAVAVPVTASDVAATGMILEYMGYISRDMVLPTVYDVTLQRKLTRDDESSGMLDIIFENRVYDLGMIYDWGGVGMLINGLTFKTNANFTSAYAAIEEKAQTALEVTIDYYMNPE